MEYMVYVHYASILGNLMYVVVYTRTYIALKIRVSNRFMANLGTKHWDVVQRVFIYFQVTYKYYIFYQVMFQGTYTPWINRVIWILIR